MVVVMSSGEQKNRTITTTIRIDPEILRKAKHVAVDLGIPCSELIGRALRAYIEQLERNKQAGGLQS
jgi:antitoxin component of RelBE/YafQ-DinJ toxin-antitoxin module